jgi:CRP-like cAMP-binding protein
VAPNEFLFKEGEIAKHVFIVKRGRLRAMKGRGEKQITLGEIGAGEFVGEMAHINHEPRSASVQALEDCELIEIPFGSLDMVLFSRPAWSQALVLTLSKRLKSTNAALVEKS